MTRSVKIGLNLVMVCAVLALGACATVQPVARKSAVAAGGVVAAPAVSSYAKATEYIRNIGTVTRKGTMSSLSTSAPAEVTGTDVTFHFTEGTWRCPYAATPKPVVRNRTLAQPPTSFEITCDQGTLNVWGSAERNAQRVAAWQFMIAGGTESAAARQQFVDARDAYLGGQVGPDIPESVRASKVQAEVAVREQHFWDAVSSFEDGLAIAPWWPQGNFNIALLYGDLKLYTAAVRYMERYLELVPGAANARQAQDKVYEWRGRMGKAG